MTRKEQSFGIIPVRNKKDCWEVLLVQHGAGHWGFPKGHPEKEETPQQTAIRELFEETGLKVDAFLSEEAWDEVYFFQYNNERIHKTVTYFVAKVSGKIKIQEDEVQAIQWATFEEAKKLIKFQGAKELLNRTEKFLCSL